jgi:alpha-L-fucosidase
VPPDQRGLIHENDVARLTTLRAVLDETFSTNLAKGATVSATGGRDERAKNPPAAVVDGDPRTYWAADEGATQASLTIDLGQPTAFDRILIQEDIRLGQRVRSFVVEADDGTGWRTIAEGTTVGYKRLLRFPKVGAKRVRLIIRAARAAPAISEFGLFSASPREE